MKLTHLVFSLLIGALVVPTTASAQFDRTVKKRTVKKASAAQEDVEVKNVEIVSINGNQVQLNLYLYKQGGDVRKPVKVNWVSGGRRTELWSGNAQFRGVRGGNVHNVSVRLPGNAANGQLEIVADKSDDRVPGNNSKTINFQGKGDLDFDGAPQITERQGATPNREWEVKVKNLGPGDIPAGCQVEIELTEQGAAKKTTVRLPALRGGASHPLKLRYNYARSSNRAHNQIKAKIQCRHDLAAGNNVISGRLR